MWNKWMDFMPNDGVLGLGLQGKAPKGVRPILDIMKEQSVISERVFGLWMGRDPTESGELTLGGLNEDLYQGNITWVNLPPSPQWWAVKPDSVTIDGHTELDICSGNCSVMPVSNTPYFVTSMAKAKAINDVLNGSALGEGEVAKLDCETLDQLPKLEIVIGGRTMEMDPSEYTFQIPLPDETLCISGFMGLPMLVGNFFMLGTMFMQKYYIAYDRENDRMGFADSVNQALGQL